MLSGGYATYLQVTAILSSKPELMSGDLRQYLLRWRRFVHHEKYNKRKEGIYDKWSQRTRVPRYFRRWLKQVRESKFRDAANCLKKHMLLGLTQPMLSVETQESEEPLEDLIDVGNDTNQPGSEFGPLPLWHLIEQRHGMPPGIPLHVLLAYSVPDTPALVPSSRGFLGMHTQRLATVQKLLTESITATTVQLEKLVPRCKEDAYPNVHAVNLSPDLIRCAYILCLSLTHIVQSADIAKSVANNSRL